jgi:hypothetical protein
MGSSGLMVTTPRGSVGGAAKTMEAAKNMSNPTNKNNERFIQKPPSVKLFALNTAPAFLNEVVNNSQCLNQGQEEKLIYYEIATFQAQFRVPISSPIFNIYPFLSDHRTND